MKIPTIIAARASSGNWLEKQSIKSTRTLKPSTDKSPTSSKHGIFSAGPKSYKDMSNFYEEKSSSSDGSVAENLDKLKQLFSGSKNSIKGLKKVKASPSKELQLTKGKTM